MMAALAFDALLCLLIVATAAGAVAGRRLFTGVALFVVYGLLLALGWVRLGAVDVALAEAAIGAGLTGVLMLSAVARLEVPRPSGFRPRAGPALLCLALVAGGAWAVASGPRAEGLGRAVDGSLAQSGADNPVTAVLLNFRAYDTLLESVVLLIALIAVWSLTRDRSWRLRPGIAQHVRSEGVLASFGRLLLPFGLIVGIYLVWTGTSAPGGAFQGGTVLAAVWLLAMMAALSQPPPTGRAALRWALVAGPLLFLLAGLWGLGQGAFLAYPPQATKALILTIELVLALSIAVTLALLVLGPSRREP